VASAKNGGGHGGGISISCGSWHEKRIEGKAEVAACLRHESRGVTATAGISNGGIRKWRRHHRVSAMA
jgi:hypothetical protein